MARQFVYVEDPATAKVNGTNLTITNLQVPSSADAGQQVTVSYTLKNTGTLAIDTDVSQELFISSESSFSSSARPLDVSGTLPSVAGLQPEQSVTAQVSMMVPDDLIGGQKYVYVYVNKNHVLKEKKSEDNMAKAPLYLNGHLPNLVLSGLSVPATIMTSEKTVVSWTLANNGDWDAVAVSCNVYLSTDATLSNDDRLLTTVSSDPLAMSSQQNMQATIELSDQVVGVHFLIVKASNSQQEVSSNDNTVVAAFTAKQSPLPDLLITDLTTDGTWRSGSTMTLHAVVKNTGDDATHADMWTDVFYLSTGYVLDVQKAVRLGSKTHVGKLQKDGTYTITATFNIPATLKGYYVLYAVADGTATLTEKSKANNQAQLTVCIEDQGDTPADLVVTRLSAPSRIMAGEPVTIAYDIDNQGEYVARGSLRDVLYMSEDNVWDENDTMVGVVTGNVSIGPGTRITRTVTGRITNMPEGSYYLIVRTNSTHTIAESDYDNNQMVNKSAGSVEFATLPLGGAVTVHTSGLFKLPLHSGLSGKTIGLYLSMPDDVTAGLYTAFGTVPSTARHERSATDIETAEQELLLPDVEEGTYYILAQDNAAVSRSLNEFVINGEQDSQESPMTLSAREVQFGATTLSITEGGSNGWISTEVHGALLDSIMDFRLAREGESIPTERVLFKEQTSSYVTFNLNEAQTGTYDVVSELPDGTRATLPEGFRIVPGQSVNLGINLNLPQASREFSYAPISIAYANSGNTDIAIKELLVIAQNAVLSNTVEGLKEGKTEMHIVPDFSKDRRGYVSIPPGTQEVINCYIGASNGCTVIVYIVK